MLEYNPLDIEAWLDFSTVLYEQGKLLEASETMAEAIKNNPEAAELYYRMVAYLFALGNYADALGFLETALTTDPDKHYILFEYLPQLQDNSAIINVINRYIR